jgi:hypothetical protein
VVGRLVEQQQVGVGDQQPGQRRARLLAARQLAGERCQSAGAKPRPDSAASTRTSSE